MPDHRALLWASQHFDSQATPPRAPLMGKWGVLGYLMWESRCSGVWVRGDTLLVSEPTKPLSVSGDAIQGS